ncbi:sugar transporter [Aggregatibacter segnis]|jgi:probable sugar efflux transporter|uniref:Probable sugar efflux transporter n=1 Tax=Aggregatibacter segnis TaxID=739 RepID=A0A8B2U225_9PAST|nr:sugar transporter [Aggregatibacter segnis]RDE71598.1 sugar transporter [Aggregatibacter segnis]
MYSLQIVRRLKFFRVILLAFAGFVFNTTEFLPVALLSDIADSFHIPVEHAGLMITLYAWIVSLMSLPFMLMTAKLERRSLLIKLLVVFVVSHVLSVLAWDFWMLLLSRIGIAFTHAIFWSITASLAVRVAPKDKKPQAIGLLAMGSALAMVLGLPLGRVIGQYFGWREAFAIIAVLAFTILILLYRFLPHLESRNAGSLRSLPLLIKRPLLLGLYALTILIISAHFTAYSYIEPFMVRIGEMSDSAATVILLIFGLSGIIASLLFNRFYQRSPTAFLLTSMGILGLSLVLLLPLSGSQFSMFLLAFIWGIGISGIGLSLQVRVLQLASDATDVAMAIYSGLYNVGIGGGALLGNQVMQHLGLANIGFSGAAFAMLGIGLFVYLHVRYGKSQGNALD